MSQESVELVRSLYEARDPSRWFDALDEEVELDLGPVPDSPVIRGKDAAIRWSRRWWGAWEGYTLEAAEVIDASDRVVVVHDERGRGRGSGVRLERRWAVIFTLRAGKVVRFRAFQGVNTREEALEAAELAE